MLVEARLALNEPAKAAPEAARAAALAVEIGDARRLADAWHALGRSDVALGRLGPALMRLQDARDAFREADRTAELAAALNDLADLSYRLGRRDRAAAQFEEAAALHAKLGDTAAEADDRLDLASVRLDLGDPAGAARDAALARDGFLAADDERNAIEAMVVLAKAQSLGTSRDAPATAATTIRDALDRSSRAHRNAPADRVRLLLLSADLESRLGRSADVAARLQATPPTSPQATRSLRAAVASATARLAVPTSPRLGSRYAREPPVAPGLRGVRVPRSHAPRGDASPDAPRRPARPPDGRGAAEEASRRGAS